MHFFKALLALTACGILVVANPLDNNILSKRTSCSTPDGAGTCQSTSSCGTFSVAGYCPGGVDNQCCVSAGCSTSYGSGTCKSTSKSCSGQYVAGACPGPSSVQCCVANPTCSTPDGSGKCVSTSSCGAFSVAGYCPGSSSIQCCISKTCSTPKGSGTCLNASKGCSGGSFIAGYCPGDSSIECCVKGATTTTAKPTTSTSKPTTTASPPPAGSTLAAFDVSSAMPDSFWSCMRTDHQKAVIRGYSQACGVGGEVDSNLAPAYAAASKSFSSIDVYMFPCTGTQPTGVACKSPATQISEFEAEIAKLGINPGHLWLDVEPCSGECACWTDVSTNQALAKQFTAIMRTSKYKWGIYGNGNQWTTMFPSRDTDIGSDLPLWAVQDDGEPGVSNVDTFMGGWTKAYAKQWSLSDTLCGSPSQEVDLDTFSG